MVENTDNIVAVSKTLGRDYIKTTMRYFHLDKSLKEAVEILANSSHSVAQEVL